MAARPSRWFALLVLTIVLSAAPACRSSAEGLTRDGLGSRIAERFAYRPVYPLPPGAPRTRPLYLSGYPGAHYGPEGQASPWNPTGYRSGRRHGLWRLFGHDGD